MLTTESEQMRLMYLGCASLLRVNDLWSTVEYNISILRILMSSTYCFMSLYWVIKHWQILIAIIVIRNPFENGHITAFSTFINPYISFTKMNWQGVENFCHVFQKETGHMWLVISTQISNLVQRQMFNYWYQNAS